MFSQGLLVHLNFIRWKNLLIIAAAQLLVRYFIINPVFNNFRMIEHSLSDLQFFLLVLSTICIAASGYIINDYFDVGIDEVNKPMKVMVGRYFSKKETIRMHLGFNIAGSALGIVVAWLAGNVKLGFIFIVAAGMLWFYARTFKKTFLLGNIIVSLATALTLLLPAFFETELFSQADLIIATANQDIMIPVMAYALFAFLTTLIREIIKDAEDIEGDRMYGSKTLPVTLGVRTAKWVITMLSAMLIGLLFFAQRTFFAESLFLNISYIFIALQLPTAALVFYLVPAKEKKEFSKLSNMMKAIMLLGILSIPVFYFFNQNV